MIHPIAKDLYEKFSEHLEMCMDPRESLINMLAITIEQERSYVKFLEKRLEACEKLT